MQVLWNPWHGCDKISAGCQNCYVYRRDARYEKDSSIVTKTASFDLPIKRSRNGDYKVKSGTLVNTCFTSDFLLEKADVWREEAWRMIKERYDLNFFFITKRIDRFWHTLPNDWGDGYDNVCIGCTVENTDRANYRLPIFLAAPIKHRYIICEPLLSGIDLTEFLCTDGAIQKVIAGGESGYSARVCEYEWILKIRDACETAKVPFWFKQTGANFKKDGKLYPILRKDQHTQARKANINLL